MALPRTLAGPSAGTYKAKVLSYGPFAYWMLAETAGTTAVCQVNPLQNGTYARNVTVMGTAAGIGDGNTAPVFNGTNDWVNVYSATLVAAFNGATGTAFWWLNHNWAINVRDDFFVFADAAVTSYVHCRKNNANGLYMEYDAGATLESYVVTPYNPVGWVSYAITWNKPADEVRFYIGGAWQHTDNTLGVFAGPLAATRCDLMAVDNAGTNAAAGNMAHFALFTSVLGDAAIADLSTV